MTSACFRKERGQALTKKQRPFFVELFALMIFIFRRLRPVSLFLFNLRSVGLFVINELGMFVLVFDTVKRINDS